MKSTGAGALISPDIEGWRVLQDGVAKKFPTLGEAVAALPLKTAVRLAIPCQAALLERLTLPATDREELAGMLQLQLEKTLPYPVEEMSSDFEVIRSAENESTLLSVATHSGQLDEICQPLRDISRLPQKITLFAMHVAAACPVDETVLAIYAEQGHFVLAICEQGKLSWAQTVSGFDDDTLLAELPQMMLAAEMEGVPTQFTSVRLDEALARLERPLRDLLKLPVELLSLEGLPEPTGNLVPSAWKADTRRIERAERLKQRLLLAAVIYLLCVAGAFVYLAWLKREAQKIAVQYAAARPQLELINKSERRWIALQRAIDPRFYTVEILFLAHRNLPTQDVRITEFSQTDGRWTLVGEAPSANLAIEYAEKLKAEKELEEWKVVSGPPAILKGEQAKFSIEGQP
jgi:type II secretory pathway component PulL